MARVFTPAKAFWLIICAIMLAACGDSSLKVDDSSILIEPGFIRTPNEGALSTAGYFSVTSPIDDVLLTATMAPADSVEIHTMKMDDGVMRMRRAEEILLPAGKKVKLTPGGAHLMIFSPDKKLMTAEAVEVTLTFKVADPVTIEIPVRRGPDGHAH